MERKVVQTADGSTTIQLTEWNEQYHSMHGAIQESRHVFITMGLEHVLLSNKLNSVSILEMGLGTGLNALMTYQALSGRDVTVNYTGLEAYPISREEFKALNYPKFLKNRELVTVFQKMHDAPWEEHVEIAPNFKLTKRKQRFEYVAYENNFDLIYFDAFGARVQPELWTEDIFGRMYYALSQKGILVTYAAKGSVRRAMQACGFAVERLPGPPGKREMLRAAKNK